MIDERVARRYLRRKWRVFVKSSSAEDNKKGDDVKRINGSNSRIDRKRPERGRLRHDDSTASHETQKVSSSE